MRVLVTGGAGFIGTNLVRRLLSREHAVTVLDDLSTGLASNVTDLDVALVTGELQDLPAVMDAADGADAIVHLGARGSVPRSIRNPLATHSANATGTLYVLEAAREHGIPVVFSSSSSVYGANTALPKTEDMWTAPLTPYAASKLVGEGYVRAYAESYGLAATTFRFFNVFGPWQRPDHDYAAVIPKWIWAALREEPIHVFGDGSVTRDFTYVDDVVTILVQTVESGLVHPSPVNLAFGNNVSLNDVLDQLRATLDIPLQVSYEPPRLGDVPRSQNKPTLLRSLFPDLVPVSFPEAFAATTAWLRDHGGLVAGGPEVAD